MAIPRHHECPSVLVAELNGHREMIEPKLEELGRAEMAQVVPANVGQAAGRALTPDP